MEKVSPKMAAAMGVGFIGFILAAYSYNKYHEPEYSNEVKHIVNNEEAEARGKEIKKEVKKSIDEKKSNWKKFWYGAYTNISNDKSNEKIGENKANNVEMMEKDSKPDINHSEEVVSSE